MTAMTWGSIKLSGALDHVINSFQFRDRQIAQSLNGIQNRILESPDDSSQLSQNPQTFAYLGFQALLPQQTIQEALRLSTYPNQELNIDRVISFVGSMKSRPREGMSQRMFELFQPKWVGFDFYFDFKNPEEPELFIAIRILPHKPPPEKIHQPAKAPTPPKAGSEKQSGLVGG